MTPEAIAERVAQIGVVRAAGVGADPGSVTAALVAVREVTSWAAAQQAALVGVLARVDPVPELAVATATRTSTRAAAGVVERSATLGQMPALEARLEAGEVVAAHADAVTRASKQFDTIEERAELFDRVDRFADTAAVMTVEEFRRRVDREAANMRRDDGTAKFERQQRAVRVRSWTDNDGMWNVTGRFDPVTGVRLNAALTSTIEALFAEQVPEFCPADPIEKQRFLAAHAMTRLVLGEHPSGKAGRPEYVVVIDADAPDRPGPVACWPIPIEVPTRVLAELLGDGRVETIIVRNGIVLHAPGNLNLGRSTRLANRDQRRALRGLYRTCAMPGCTVGYDHCKLHHIIWWRHGGRTDLDNLVPVCTKHHANIHNDNWTIRLGPQRELTLTMPNGTIQTTGPPTIHDE